MDNFSRDQCNFSSSASVENCRWLDDGKENLSWEETLNDLKIKRLLKNQASDSKGSSAEKGYSNHKQELDETANTVSTDGCQWLDDRKENLSWEETLNDPKLQKFLRKKESVRREKAPEKRKSNKQDLDNLSSSFSTITIGFPFSDFGISIKEKKILYKRRQKENRKLRAKERDLETQDRIEQELTSLLDFEVKYMRTHKKPLYQSYVLISSLNDLDRLIRAFLLDGNQQQLSLCAMDSSIRSIVKDLLELYNLNFSVLDKRDLKHLALYKTKRSGIPLWDKKQIQHDQHHPSGIFFNSPPLSKVIHALHLKWVKSCHQDAKYLKFSDLRFIDSCKNDVEEPTESKGLKVVGEGAPELTESNVGFRMLQKMGWAPDIKDTLSETNSAPIQVVVRKGKTGLGFSS